MKSGRKLSHLLCHYGKQQISAYVAAIILVEGIKRAGRESSREKLVLEMEGRAEFQAGPMPPLRYSRSRRIGALGGYVVELYFEQKKFGAARK